jgi:putative oxidoreductase
METKVKRGWLKKSYWGVVQGEHFLGSFLLLIIRLYWGGLLVISGIGKLMNIYSVADYFATLHIQYPLAIAFIVSLIEFLGGISLFVGLFTRFFSILLSVVFIAAYMTAHKEALQTIFKNPSLFISQDPFLFLYASLVVLCFGPGFISIDYWIEKRSFGTAL